MRMITLSSGKRRFQAESATTPFEKFKGLMLSGRKNILFIFEREGDIPIHSFFVLFPFDAIYLDGQGFVVDVRKGIPPFTPIVRNMRPAKYLLELCETNEIKVGDRIGW